MDNGINPQYLQDQDLDEAHRAIGTVSRCINSAISRGSVKPDVEFINKLQEALLLQLEKLDVLK
jgi:hypothetical protein